ncbi:uracil-DNA glycosylase [Aspergillus glaucus CBS 516.65]|uniref:Uracil-DNA glycosylase n=1 Tax=Aspergillus glaucus CBS 516.65 TaxID=1160497 RepID=A0A1L9VVV4_ASPGL|nr:hypothetical protein ASPGLDRAFT_32502 [Aspergillus glaucus CBS 516.65]OJJ88042.1 hypothetical protein ASPGLDRAFT_32502 [Aspergillus glaucus CBS 516.65]
MSSSAGTKRDAGHLKSPATDSKKTKTNGSITSFFGAPKAKPANADANARPASVVPSNFNKQKWVDSLTPEQRVLLQLEIDTMDESWLARLKEEVVTPEFLELKRFLKKEKDSGAKIFPPENEVYSWTQHTPLNKVKVVVVGQDPYHNHNQAHGLAFSVRPPTIAPPSLINIYKEIKNDYPSFQAPPNKGGLLIPWADRGVLMLNACLTVRAHQANSHSNKGWERFTQKVIDLIARVRTRGVVFLAWGAPAGKRVAGIDRKRHYVLQSVHPSPLSASRGFFNNGHFRKCNDWLAERYGADEIIDWNLVPKTSTSTVTTTQSTIVSKEESTVPAEKPTESKPVAESGKPAKPADEEDEFDEDFDALEALVAEERKQE